MVKIPILKNIAKIYTVWKFFRYYRMIAGMVDLLLNYLPEILEMGTMLEKIEAMLEEECIDKKDEQK